MASRTEPKPRKAVARKGAKRPHARVVSKSEEPLYLQVVRALKDEIVRGVHPVGSQLPTEEELCQRFSVSRYTVREALRLLREDHLVSSRKGAGTTVVPPRASDSYVHEVGWRKDSRFRRERRRWKYSAATDWLTAESRRLPSTPIRHPDFVIR